MAIRTLNQIVSEFKEIADQHRQINNFTVGTIEDFATSGTTNYPAWWVSYQSNGFEDRRENFSFSFWVVDRVKKDRSNLIEVHSDMKQIAMDIIAQLNDSAYKWAIDKNISLSAIYEPFHEDEIAGWTFDITISQAFTKDVCQIPFIQSPTVGRSQSGYNPNTPVLQYVPTYRELTIDGVTYDLSANRSWSTSGSTSSGSGLKSGIATASVTDVYTTTITGVTSYTLNDAYVIKFNTANSNGATININGLGAVQLTKNNDVILTGGDITVGQEFIIIYDGTNFQMLGIAPNQMFAYVTNADSVAITKGQPVYAFGASGDRMSVKLANNSSEATSSKTVGLVFSNSIAPGGLGFVITQGVLSNVNTAAFNPGDTLYVGSSAGTLTKTMPYAPNHLTRIGIVERANAGNGLIYVFVQNGFQLDELSDVDITTTPPANNDILIYSSGTTLWNNKNIFTAINLKRDYLIAGNQTTTSNLASAVTELVYSASANKRYSINGYIRIGCNNTGGVKLSVTIPSGASMAIALNGIAGSGTSLLYSNINISNTLTGGAYNTFSGTSIINVSGEVELSSTAGNIQFNFASTTNLQTSTIYQLGTLLNFVEL
jgi:hypothetical protein